ncbi:amidohydrolase [Alloacidobacterium dinghuense]|uniref:Amidohydrolase n=1 Tax=Alloacidobacterium dinghuense TaxID=2763107 RepID=A0A7G8BFJ2_9BACT|nr:amidohydrolase family protein [Alloacidobacterium dinghuense]QNI31312.1 amidohydrolase [Alloacidobacterium dinghuense]
MRVIALEEAFLHHKLRALYSPAYVRLLDMVGDRLTNVGQDRIRRMDAAGIDLQVLSHVQPGVQALECDLAIRLSREVNDWLAERISQYPTRFAGFAMLPMQSPADAADELERTVTQFGFKGALINGHTQGRYLDEESFAPIFERAQALDVPIYIHPTDPPQSIIDTYYKDSPAMMQSWGWQVETGTHLLKLISSGVFDRYPRLKIIVGHMGELIPFTLKRVNAAITMGNWLLKEQKGMQKSLLCYMRANVFITTSGFFDQAALQCAVAELGIDNVLFSVDDPFGDNFEGVDFLRKAQLSNEDREKLAYRNAERVLRLSSATHSQRGSSHSFFSFKANIKAKMARMMLSFLVR